MSITFDNYSDRIEGLPTDKNLPTHAEIQIVDALFKQKHTLVQTMLLGMKDVLMVGLLFILFSLPQIDEVIVRFAPATSTSSYILVGVKTVLFMFAYFVVKNSYLVRK